MKESNEFFNSLNYIKEHIGDMSKTERAIAQFILKNPESVVNGTLRTIAIGANVSEGSVINFSNRVGFDGFTKLKLNMAQCLAFGNSIAVNDETIVDGSVKSVMNRIISNAVSSFNSTYNITSEAVLMDAANAILKAKTITIYGVANSASTALAAYYRMLQLGFRVSVVTDPSMCAMTAGALDSDSLAIAISHSGRTPDVIRAVETATERKAVSICLTSYADSPLAKHSSIVLLAASNEMETMNSEVNAQLSQLMIVDTICTYLNRLRNE